MMLRFYFLLFVIACCVPITGWCQHVEKINFDATDTTDGYYLAIPPQSKTIRAVIVVLTSFRSPEQVLPETKLHNVASANDMLTVLFSMKEKIYADSSAVSRLNAMLADVINRFSADTGSFVLSGFDEAGNIALRYTEHAYHHPERFKVQPKAVFAMDTQVDLFALWRWSERQIKKNYWPGAVGDAKYYLDVMTKENGSIGKNPEKYKELTAFYSESETPGNEQYLKNVAVRLYYDTDIEWHIKNRRNSYADTKMPEGSELINRLIIQGNKQAEFISSRLPAVRSDGTRHPNSFSIVDEVECVQWIKKSLDIFDPNTWQAPYTLIIPQGWSTERFPLPADFAVGMRLKGVEDLRFPAGWGESTSNEYWSYAYLWWLNGKNTIDANTLQQNLTAYYTGLVNRNIIGRKIPAEKVISTNVVIKKLKTETGDLETFGGTIRMLDYMMQRPITLNTLIHVKDCLSNHHQAVIIELSPQPLTHAVWKQFRKIDESFRCNQ